MHLYSKSKEGSVLPPYPPKEAEAQAEEGRQKGPGEYWRRSLRRSQVAWTVGIQILFFESVGTWKWREGVKQKTALGLADDSWLSTRKSSWLKNIFENIPLGKASHSINHNFFFFINKHPLWLGELPLESNSWLHHLLVVWSQKTCFILSLSFVVNKREIIIIVSLMVGL